MSTPFVGEIQIFAFSYPPKGWALCNGQPMPISQNQALYALLGTTYGGNGTTIFNLPNLQERCAIHQGQGPGLSNYALGQQVGADPVALTTNQIASHVHPLNVVQATGDATTPIGSYFGSASESIGNIYGGTANNSGSGIALPTDGAGAGHSNRQPYLTVNFCIALQGLFPPRP
jgi:microcystin-dependent protein